MFLKRKKKEYLIWEECEKCTLGLNVLISVKLGLYDWRVWRHKKQ